MYKKTIIIIQGAMYNLQKLSKFRPHCSNFTFLLLSRKLSVFDPTYIKRFMLIFDRRISPESLSVEF
jgi:hypothetical protein